MSKNKSQKMARQAGGHSVFGPRSGTSESIDALRARIEFVRSVAGREGSDHDVIRRFLKILSEFEKEPTVVDEVSKRTGFAKREALKELLIYQKKYKSEIELERLFANKRW